jgi:serine/threonine protein kinase
VPGFSAPLGTVLRCALHPPGANATCDVQCDGGCFDVGPAACLACKHDRVRGVCVPARAPAAVPAVALVALVALLAAACAAVWHVRRKQRKTAGAMQRLRIQSEFVHEDEWEFPRGKLRKVKPLAAGNFGEVWLYEARGIDAHAARAWRLQHCGSALYGAVWVACKVGGWTQWAAQRQERLVAVKTLRASPAGEPGKPSAAASLTTDELLQFRQEATIMKRLRHPHIVNLLAESIAEAPAMIIMEYCEEGSLLDHLKAAAASGAPIALATRVRYCADIAGAMAYIHAHGIIHRDLAARNCLLTQGAVKVSDFGLSRKALLRVGGGGGEHYYQVGGYAARLPVRWTAPEVLETLRFTEASDVWSFGVTAWEIFTDGRTPYEEIGDTTAIPGLVRRGLIRLKAPADEACPLHIWALVVQCLAFDAAERPAFAALAPQWIQAGSPLEPRGGAEESGEELAPFRDDADPGLQLVRLGDD